MEARATDNGQPRKYDSISESRQVRSTQTTQEGASQSKTPAGATEDYVAIGRRNPSDGQTKANAVRDVGEEGTLQDLKSAVTSKK